MMTQASRYHHSTSNVTDRSAAAYDEVRQLCEEAKRLSLVEYFERHSGLEAKSARHRWYIDWCPRCGSSSKGNYKVYITDDEFYSCWACSSHGDIITAEIERAGGNAREAAEHLLGRSHSDVRQGIPVKLRDPESEEKKRLRQLEEERKYAAVREVLKIVCKQTKSLRDDGVLTYLTEERGLPMPLIESAIERGILRTLPSKVGIASAMIRSLVPEDLLRAAHFWKEDAKVPWIAYRPLWFFLPGAVSAELRIIHKPKSKEEKKSLRVGITDAPYFWEGKNPLGCACVEGALDMLSLVALGYEGDIMGLPGVNNWVPEWFARMRQARGTQRFDTMFDNDVDPDKFDNPGQDAAVKVGAALQGLQIPWKNIVPPAGDVNDYLLSTLKKR